MNIALGFAYSWCFIMKCLILIKKVQVYIIHKLIYCGFPPSLSVCVCVCVDLSDRLRCSFAVGNTTRQGTYFSKGHILTISPTVKRICPSTGEYIMHADPKFFNLDTVNDSVTAPLRHKDSRRNRWGTRCYSCQLLTAKSDMDDDSARVHFTFQIGK